MDFKTDGTPALPGWYVFRHKRTGDFVVRQLREDGNLYNHLGAILNTVSNWTLHYDGWVKVATD